MSVVKDADDVDFARRQKIASLLSDVPEATKRLETFLAASEERLRALHTQWDEHRAPLDEEYEQLLAKSGQKSETEQLAADTSQMRNVIEQITGEAVSKESVLAQLRTEAERVKTNLNRSIYTRRILDIVANIQKQREGIEKILDDTRSAQREINSLTGKLSRTFAATDELIFKHATQSESVRRVYKLVASLHELCAEVVKIVEDTGATSREIRDVEDKLDSEDQKTLANNLERIVTDFLTIREENQKLEAKLAELTV